VDTEGIISTLLTEKVLEAGLGVDIVGEIGLEIRLLE
jgi:hypothetical protein